MAWILMSNVRVKTSVYFGETKELCLVTSTLDTSVQKYLSSAEIDFMKLKNNHNMKAIEIIFRHGCHITF